MDEVFDLENGVLDLDVLRRTAPVLVQAEWIVLEHQMRSEDERLNGQA